VYVVRDYSMHACACFTVQSPSRSGDGGARDHEKEWLLGASAGGAAEVRANESSPQTNWMKYLPYSVGIPSMWTVLNTALQHPSAKPLRIGSITIMTCIRSDLSDCTDELSSSQPFPLLLCHLCACSVSYSCVPV